MELRERLKILLKTIGINVEVATCSYSRRDNVNTLLSDISNVIYCSSTVDIAEYHSITRVDTILGGLSTTSSVKVN